MVREACARTSSETQIWIHISLPCKGGSPLLRFTARNPKHEREFFHLLKACEKYLDEIRSMKEVVGVTSFELPKANQYWKSHELESFLEKQEMAYQSECHACAMGLETQSGLKVGKTFRIQLSSQPLAKRLSARFACKCGDDHAPFNNVDYHSTERYSLKFARFFTRSWIYLVRTASVSPVR